MTVETEASHEEAVTLDELESALKQSFSPAILADPTGWSPEHPAFGHCSAAAQIVDDLFGGEIHGYWFGELAKRWEDNVRGSHFLNVLPNGRRVDFTRSQFPSDFPYDEVMAPEKGRVVNREKMFGGAGSAGQHARLHIAVTYNLWRLYRKKIDCPYLANKHLPWEISDESELPEHTRRLIKRPNFSTLASQQ